MLYYLSIKVIMNRIYKTIVSPLGINLEMDILFPNKETNEILLNKSGLKDKNGNTILYTTTPIYLDELTQKCFIYHVSNANKVNTYSEFMKIIKQYHPEYLSFISKENIINELNLMASFIMDGEKLYPNMKKIIAINK